jgi:hypothetical protein
VEAGQCDEEFRGDTNKSQWRCKAGQPSVLRFCHVIATSRHELMIQDQLEQGTRPTKSPTNSLRGCLNSLPESHAIYVRHNTFTDQDGLFMRIDSKPSRRVQLLPHGCGTVRTFSRFISPSKKENKTKRLDSPWKSGRTHFEWTERLASNVRLINKKAGCTDHPVGLEPSPSMQLMHTPKSCFEGISRRPLRTRMSMRFLRKARSRRTTVHGPCRRPRVSGGQGSIS